MKRKKSKADVTAPMTGKALPKGDKKTNQALATAPKTEPVPLSLSKQVAFTLVFCLLIFSIFAAVELSMRAAHYGIDTRLFVTPKYMKSMYIENLLLEDKYFSKQSQFNDVKLSDSSIRNVFPARKSKDTLRGFMIGESSVQGYPYQSNQSFSAITEAALKASGKYRDVQIINLGVSAMTSYYIKEASLKALQYQPDFLLIYAGHNEYYGNVSYTTGGNYFTKTLYLSLKEFRFFQWLFDTVSGGGQEKQTGTTLMAKQFNNHRIPKNDKVDKQVAADFIKNMDVIVKTYAAKKIPVIIVEPISNFCDMPPFAGDGDARYRSFIKTYAQVILNGDKVKLQAFYNERLSRKDYNHNANILYLDAVAKSILTGKTDLKAFIAAKDMDTVPFRARTALVQALKKYYARENKVTKDLYYIPLMDELSRRYGQGIFGNQIFIDQLHFSQRGQRMLAQVMTDKIAQVFSLKGTEKKRTVNFLKDNAAIDHAIYFLPAYHYAVDRQIHALTSAPPFNTMIIKYHPSRADMFVPANDADKGMVRILESMFRSNGNNNIDAGPLANYYLKLHDPLTAKRYVEAYVHMYPGSYFTHLMAARWFVLERNIDKAYDEYKTAYLLSNKKEQIYDEMRETFYNANQSYLFDKIKRIYGKPESESE